MRGTSFGKPCLTRLPLHRKQNKETSVTREERAANWIINFFVVSLLVGIGIIAIATLVIWIVTIVKILTA